MAPRAPADPQDRGDEIAAVITVHFSPNCRPGGRSDVRWAKRVVRGRRQIERARSRQRRMVAIDIPHAGTAFDGRHLFQIAEKQIQKIDPKTGQVLATIPAPGDGGDSGLAWAEGSLWVSPLPRAQGSIRSTPRPARRCAPSSRTASSPASPGSTARTLARQLGWRRE